jgi:hypothetical protein
MISREPQKRLENASHETNSQIQQTTLCDSRKLPVIGISKAKHRISFINNNRIKE